MSSIKIQSFFDTSPITFITSDTLAFSLLLSIIARSQSTLFAIALARTTPPTSGETITVFLLSNFFLISSINTGAAKRLSVGISKNPCI